MQNGRCYRTALESSEKGFCILHEAWSHKNEEETKKTFYSEIEKGITNFEGCILPGIDLSKRKIEDVVGISFNRAIIKGDINFEGSEIGGFAGFREVKIGGNAWFRNAIIHGDLVFTRATIKGIIWFERTTVDGWTSFDGATMQSITIYPSVHFTSLSFKYAKIGHLRSEEGACRMAKITQERAGDRVLADYHFYREMVAKRKQKNPIIRFLELFVQYIFGYGVHPWRVIATWLVTVFCLAFVYWMGNGVDAADSFLEHIYFSVVTAATPGYGGYKPAPGFYQGLASFEAIFGTFMWAAFIATFARKYMR